MYGQKLFKFFDFWFITTSNNMDQLERYGLSIKIFKVNFELEWYGLKSFWKEPSMCVWDYSKWAGSSGKLCDLAEFFFY